MRGWDGECEGRRPIGGAPHVYERDKPTGPHKRQGSGALRPVAGVSPLAKRAMKVFRIGGPFVLEAG